MGSRLLALLVLSGALATAQPFLYYRGGRNAASILPPDHPSGSVARGSIFSLSGRNLGPPTPAQPAALPADIALAGVTVDIAQGSVSMPAIPVYVSSSQVKAVMPSSAPLGRVSVRVTFNGRRSNATLVSVVESSVGLFAVNDLGFGPGVAQNVTPDLQTPNTTLASAQPGQTVILSATGLGAVPYADNIVPAAQDLDTPLEILVGGKLANRRYAGRADSPGQDQIVVDLPPDAPLGCYVPVEVRAAGTVVSNAVTIAISADSSSPCADTFNPVSGVLQAGGSIGVALPHRVVARVESPPGPPFDVTTDWIYAALQQVAPSAVYFNPMLSLPPLGTCTAFGTDQATFGLFVPSPTELDGGTPMTLTGPAGKVNVSATPAFRGLLGKTPDLAGAAPLFYSGPGGFGFSLPGGAQIEALSGNFTMPQPLLWTNRDQITVVDRTGTLTVNWTGADAGSSIVLIMGQSRDVPHNVDGDFLCTAPASGGVFTVPQYILGALPKNASGSSVKIALGAAGYRNPQIFSGPGLDTGFVIPSAFSLKTVAMR